MQLVRRDMTNESSNPTVHRLFSFPSPVLSAQPYIRSTRSETVFLRLSIVYPSVCDVWLWPSLRYSIHPYIHILKPLSLASYLITHLLFHSLALSLTLSVSFFLPLSLSYSSFQSDSQIPCPENIVHGSSFEEDILPRVAFTTKLHAYVCVLVWKRARVCVCAVAPRGARTACARVRVRVCVFAARVCLGIRDPTSVIPWQVDIRLRCCLCHLTQIVKLNP